MRDGGGLWSGWSYRRRGNGLQQVRPVLEDNIGVIVRNCSKKRYAGRRAITAARQSRSRRGMDREGQRLRVTGTLASVLLPCPKLCPRLYPLIFSTLMVSFSIFSGRDRRVISNQLARRGAVQILLDQRMRGRLADEDEMTAGVAHRLAERLAGEQISPR